MSQSWLVTVEGQAYGPYPYEQMQAFVSEGRVVAHSLVAAPNDAVPRRASEDPVLAPLFRPATPRAAAITEKLVPAEPSAEQKFGRSEGEGDLANFIIITDVKSRSINDLEEEIFNLGQTCPIMPQVWILKTAYGVNAVRSALMRHLGTLDTMFIVDTTHDKAAWCNFGPEPDSRIRRVWNKSASERKSA